MRRLTLQRELLSVLSTDELANVAGAAEHTLPDPHCVLTTPSVLQCPQSMVPCYSNPCTS